MIAIIGWVLALAAVVWFGSSRLITLYRTPPCDHEQYLKSGGWLIWYATLTVGSASFLSSAISEHQLMLGRASYWWAGVGLAADYFRYLAPFVFAAVGVNFISHAIIERH